MSGGESYLHLCYRQPPAKRSNSALGRFAGRTRAALHLTPPAARVLSGCTSLWPPERFALAHISGNSLRNLGDLLGREIAGNLGDLRGGHHSNTPKVSDFLRSDPSETQILFTYFSKGVIFAVSE
jgi:hypothetical protein